MDTLTRAERTPGGPLSNTAGQARAAGPRRSRAGAPQGWATWVDRAVALGLGGAGALWAADPLRWYGALAVGFLGIACAVLLGAWVVTLFSERSGARLQGPRRRPPPIWREIRDTTSAAWIAACLLAWPLSRMWSGAPTGLVWSLEEAGGGLRVALSTAAAVLALDAWLYWKHRLLHTRPLFAFHRAHHAFRDPTAFAGFAVGPVESLLTFWPLVLVAFPEATHYAPVYFALVAGFVTLNFYLHCGVALRGLEATLPRALLNTSAFHNRHHANAAVNFSEAFILWDYLCGTRERRVEASPRGAAGPGAG